jgi:flavoprotein
MSNSFELLTGPIETIQKKYEVLSDIVSEYNGKVQGSQSHMISNNSMSLIVYYEARQGQREEVKAKYQNCIRNEVKIYHQQ